MPKRFKNYALWVSLGSLLVMILNDAFHVATADAEKYVDLVLVILVAGGVINSPKEGKWFKDK